MTYMVADMSPAGRDLLDKMKTEVSNYDDLISGISVGLTIKKLFDAPISQLLDLVLPASNEWDVITKLVKSSGGLKGVLKKKLDLHWYKYQTTHNWNSADKAFIEAFYNSIKRS